MNKIQLIAFTVIFAFLAIVFFLMFVGQVTQNEAWTSMPVLAFSIISAAVAVLMLIGYVLSGRSQKGNGVHQPPTESGK
ncbi:MULTISPECIES: hypothetical protein [Serratia]|jgi:succinate-acetate transporter protein|uniref:hypothetical protein n=1 Tax=Serratia TaxID=613 RepID=UPI000C2448B1|nr:MULTISPECIES: hypothetical protein [Serratia]MBH2647850.1 hypothetical protein [Serratia ureilytica]MBH3271305.1 hypothetical protein [Serratia marcescens]PJI69138.1 hypothetical protein CUN64_05330 [Serratia sp. TKO39]HAT3516325.1 DUF2207 domain-containing protein [Serratia marcescens]